MHHNIDRRLSEEGCQRIERRDVGSHGAPFSAQLGLDSAIQRGPLSPTATSVDAILNCRLASIPTFTRWQRPSAMGRLRPFSCGYVGIKCQVFTTRAKQCLPSRPPVLYWYPVLVAMGAGFRALSGICIFSIGHDCALTSPIFHQ